MKVKTIDAEAEECSLMRKNESIHVNEHMGSTCWRQLVAVRKKWTPLTANIETLLNKIYPTVYLTIHSITSQHKGKV